MEEGQRKKQVIMFGAILMILALLPLAVVMVKRPTATSSHAAEILPGDVNHDGKVNLDDAALLRTLIAMHQYVKDADLNNDGVVDQKDIAKFYDYFAY